MHKPRQAIGFRLRAPNRPFHASASVLHCSRTQMSFFGFGGPSSKDMLPRDGRGVEIVAQIIANHHEISSAEAELKQAEERLATLKRRQRDLILSLDMYLPSKQIPYRREHQSSSYAPPLAASAPPSPPPLQLICRLATGAVKERAETLANSFLTALAARINRPLTVFSDFVVTAAKCTAGVGEAAPHTPSIVLLLFGGDRFITPGEITRTKPGGLSTKQGLVVLHASNMRAPELEDTTRASSAAAGGTVADMRFLGFVQYERSDLSIFSTTASAAAPDAFARAEEFIGAQQRQNGAGVRVPAAPVAAGPVHGGYRDSRY